MVGRELAERVLLAVGLVLALISIPFAGSTPARGSAPDVGRAGPVASSGANAFSVPVRSAGACPDGASGKRIESVYVHGDDQPSRLPALREQFRDYLERGDEAIVRAARRHGGGVRHLRYLRGARCDLPVADVTVPRAAMKDAGSVAAAIAAQGYDSPDRKYVVWYETDECGLSFGLGGSDDPYWYNHYNFGPHYATIGTACWGWAPTLHELLHSLGAVQANAPHGTKNGHCWDDEDIMCYDDQSLPDGGLVVLCPKPEGPDVVGSAANDAGNQVDCNGDDYFNTDPAPGSYLDTHWNVADSDFLDRE